LTFSRKRCKLTIMRRIIFLLIITLVSFGIISCNSKPSPTNEPEQPAGIIVVSGDNSIRISYEYYATIKDEVQHFIERLNVIIGARNYAAWRASLSPEYINHISSPENLNRISEQPIMKRRNIVLKNLNDYFMYVVVPARGNDRIQIDNIDIEFITIYRVRAFITRKNTAGEEIKEILYSLEKKDGSWTIVN